MDSITKVSEKAIVYEDLARQCIDIGSLVAVSGIGVIFGLVYGFNDLTTLYKGIITQEMTNLAIDVGGSAFTLASVLIFGGIALIGAGFIFKNLTNKEAGCVNGVCDVEIAYHERKIARLVEKNKKLRMKAERQIQNINEIEQGAVNKKIV
jgi:hypothetical protein